MKNYLKLTGFMMSALLCLFTSCSSDEPDPDKDSGGVASVQATVFVAQETLDVIDGSFIFTFAPSGTTKEIKANDLIFNIDANPVTDAKILEKFKSNHVKKATLSTTCDRSETKISIKSNLKVKQGVATTDDKAYDFEVFGAINYQKKTGGVQGQELGKAQHGIKGSALASFLEKLNNTSIVWLDIK